MIVMILVQDVHHIFMSLAQEVEHIFEYIF